MVCAGLRHRPLIAALRLDDHEVDVERLWRWPRGSPSPRPGRNEISGTKRPSMMSTWIQSAPARIDRAQPPRRAGRSRRRAPMARSARSSGENGRHDAQALRLQAQAARRGSIAAGHAVVVVRCASVSVAAWRFTASGALPHCDRSGRRARTSPRSLNWSPIADDLIERGRRHRPPWRLRNDPVALVAASAMPSRRDNRLGCDRTIVAASPSDRLGTARALVAASSA